jgi:Trk-type K+ transport system membrane component
MRASLALVSWVGGIVFITLFWMSLGEGYGTMNLYLVVWVAEVEVMTCGEGRGDLYVWLLG